jgi:hypothetical protein
VIARPVTDTTLTEPDFVHEGWFPSRLAALNRIETAAGVLERLVVVPGQYSNPGIQRLWDRLTYKVYYSSDEDRISPTIWRFRTGQTSRHASFFAHVTDDSGIERVVVTYTLGDGQWRSLDLAHSEGSPRWRGVLGLDYGERVLRCFVQAVDRAGNASVTHNKGRFFQPGTYQVYLPLVIRSR